MMTDDMALVREYAAHGSEAAFQQIVARYLNLVYSVAWRRVGEAHLAEEISQSVFITLARKAGALGPRTVLSAWLYRTTRFVAADALKSQRRRHQREQEACMQSLLNEPTGNETWQQILPLLEAGMDSLYERERTVLVLRFYQGKSLNEMGATLGTSENAAKKRVNRAVEKLRRFFAKRNVALTDKLIAGAISAHSVQTAPVALVKSVSTAVMAKGVMAGGTSLTLLKSGLLKAGTWLKVTTAAVILANAFLSQKIVATHFDFAGNPNGWMTQAKSSLLWLVAGCGLPLFLAGMGYVLRFAPSSAMNLPHRDYWLAPERKEELFNYIFRHFIWLACFEAIFMLTMMLLQIQANHQNPPHLSTPAVLAASGGFLAATAVWAMILFLHVNRVAVKKEV